MSRKINEATSTDIPIIQKLVNEYGWKVGDTLLYQQTYDIPENLKKDYPTLKNIRPDIVLQDMNGDVLAVIENNLDKENKDLLKLRTIVTQLLKPRFLYACSAERILFYDNAWRGLDAGEFKQVTTYMSLEEMKLKIEQQKKIASNKEITIDTTIAGGYDPTVGKERYYQLQCIRTIIENYKAGKQKMLIHMATGLGKTRTAVAMVKALLSSGLAKRILFVVDRRMLAKQAVDDGFSLISREYTSSWITTSNFRTRKNASIHVVVIDTLELIHSDLPSNFYDLIIVDECHRSINVNRKLIFDHFLCPRIGLTATPRIATPIEGAEVDEEDLAIIDTYKLFGCETGEPDFQFDIAKGIDEGFLAPYKPIELISSLVEEAKQNGIEFDHVLDPQERYVIALGAEKKLKLEQLNRKFISEENCLRIAEELKKNTQYGEKVILFGVSQAHCIELAKAINKVFQIDGSEKPYYAEAVISENNELNETLKAWFKKPYQKPYVAVSVDILSTGVDIPCVRYIALAALTKSVGKYIQMIGRGTRLDPKTGKFSFQILDFVGLCKRMEDNGKGTLKENKKIVKPGGQRLSANAGININPKGEYFLIDNPDPAHMIQRIEIHGDSIKIKDNIPIEEAKQIFEEELKKSQEPVVVDLKKKAEQPEYQPTDEELAKFIQWLSLPNTFMDEGHLQKMYDYPEGSAWDFLLHALGRKRIPTPKERIEKNYLSYIHTYNFTDEQIVILKKIKDVFASNVASNRDININEIFGNPIYERLIGSYETINQIFDGKFNFVINELKQTIVKRASA
ncbi:helicase conserved C-terminal domain [Lentimicrobium saccharophilum]|uniref:Helicase conserved C-terminal domain n=1 Tax=Lentimicrobium saccharophilum TaxID=1678841 RepID=A0A0S7C3U2_9BACT|nr:DEAD/DEAH box helicase family protein [Lentimicrobium saccharophilum]GAP44846.1 helicase conserved C-terminal domain [Lentimicrobium saccharophilum]